MNIIQNQSVFDFTLQKRGNIQKLKELYENKFVTRFAIVNNYSNIECEYAEIQNIDNILPNNIFKFNPRKTTNNLNFNAMMIIPTGIGSEIGGDSGDGNVAARLIGNVVDNLFTHPK